MGAKDRRQSKQSICLNCKKLFYPFYTAKGIYCSNKCQGEYIINKNNSAWKGSKAGYRAIHIWIEQRLGKPMKCEICGIIGKGKKDNRKFHWSNTSHTYKRKLKDWKRLCVKCHKAHDKIMK